MMATTTLSSSAAAASATPTQQIQLAPAPTDGVTMARFANSSDTVVVSSWDKGVRLHNGTNGSLMSHYTLSSAVLDACFSDDDGYVFAGSVDGKVTIINLMDGSRTDLGSHSKGVKCVLYNASLGVCISGGWDSTVKLWDPRAASSLVGSYDMNGKVYAMDQIGSRLVVGTAGRHVHIFDVRRMHKPEQLRESSLVHQTRCIRCFSNGEGYALSSIEGRVSIEYFDPAPAVQDRKYAFKCHRRTVNGVQELYPVNALAFHPVHGTFATGGCDGFINMWDGAAKKRICTYQSYPTSIASLDFNRDGTLLAVAASYTFERGEQDHPPDTVLIRTINDVEVQPKKRP